MDHGSWAHEAYFAKTTSRKSFDEMTENQRLATARNKAHDIHFDRRFCMSGEIAKFRGLQSLEVDFTNAYCPVGSCSDLNLAWDDALLYATDIRCVGSRNDYEKWEILGRFWDLMEESTELTDKEIEERYDWTFEIHTSDDEWYAKLYGS